jgi:hypothetical protein
MWFLLVDDIGLDLILVVVTVQPAATTIYAALLVGFSSSETSSFAKPFLYLSTKT